MAELGITEAFDESVMSYDNPYGSLLNDMTLKELEDKQSKLWGDIIDIDKNRSPELYNSNLKLFNQVKEAADQKRGKNAVEYMGEETLSPAGAQGDIDDPTENKTVAELNPNVDFYESSVDIKGNQLLEMLNEKQLQIEESKQIPNTGKIDELKKAQEKVVKDAAEKWTPSSDLERLKKINEGWAKELEEAYPEDDMMFEKKLAMAKFGLELMGGTSYGGRALPILSNAGQNLIDNLVGINSKVKAGDREKRLAQLSAKREGELATVNAEAQNQAEKNAFDWNVMSSNMQITEAYDMKSIDVDAETAKINNATTADNLKERFEVASKYLDDKFPNDEVGMVSFITKKGSRTRPHSAVRKSDGSIYMMADLTIDPTFANADGSPMMVNIDRYADLSVGTGGVVWGTDANEFFSDKVMESGGLDAPVMKLQGAANQISSQLEALATLRGTIDEQPGRVGWVGGMKSLGQNWGRNAQVAWEMFTGKHSNDNKNSQFYVGDTKKRFYITDILEADENNMLGTTMGKDENGNVIEQNIMGPEATKALKDVVNSGQMMMSQDYDRLQNALADGAKEFQLGDGSSVDTDVAQDIFGILKYDPEIPKNEVRTQSLIYALARARKTTGRLNKDDVERASLTLNLYGKSDLGVKASLEVIQVELQNYLEGIISDMKLSGWDRSGEADRQGKDAFINWMLEWTDRGRYIPSYLQPWAEQYLPSDYQDRLTFRDAKDTGIYGKNTTWSSGMEDIDMGASVTVKEGP
jgi:hypothetical protein